MKKAFRVAGVGIVLVATIAVVVALFARGQPSEDKTEADLGRSILGSERKAQLSYESTDPTLVDELSSFEEKDDIPWQGTGFYDDRVFLTGKTSLTLTSTNRVPGIAFTDRLAPLGDITDLEISIKTTSPEDLESFTVFAGSADAPDAYTFPFANLRERWNFARMPRAEFVPKDPAAPVPWEQITRLEFRAVSRPGKTIITNLDNLRVEKTTTYLDDWNATTPTFLGLAQHEGKIFLAGRGTVGTTTATWRAVPSAKDFVYRAKLIQRSSLRSGLFFRGDFRTGSGYIFWVGGIGKGDWGLIAVTSEGTTTLESGELKNMEFREGEPVWLQVTAAGERLTLAISFDEKTFTPLEEIDDVTFLTAGGIGIFEESGAETLYNNFEFTAS